MCGLGEFHAPLLLCHCTDAQSLQDELCRQTHVAYDPYYLSCYLLLVLVEPCQQLGNPLCDTGPIGNK